MVRNTYSSGRNEDRLLSPNGGNVPQQFVPPEMPGPHKRDMLPYKGSDASFNLNAMLLENIRSSDYFKGLSTIRTWEELLDQIYYDVKPEIGCTPWLHGTHQSQRASGMCSGLRGVSNAGKPTTAFMLLLKALTLRPTRGQLKGMLYHPDSPFIRATALYLLRYVCPPEELLEWFAPVLDDEEGLPLHGGGRPAVSIGYLARSLLRTLDFCGTRLPRLPGQVEREVKAAIAPYARADADAEEAAEGGGARAEGGGGGGGGARERGGAHDGAPRRPRSPRSRSRSPPWRPAGSRAADAPPEREREYRQQGGSPPRRHAAAAERREHERGGAREHGGGARWRDGRGGAAPYDRRRSPPRADSPHRHAPGGWRRNGAERSPPRGAERWGADGGGYGQRRERSPPRRDALPPRAPPPKHGADDAPRPAEHGAAQPQGGARAAGGAGTSAAANLDRIRALLGQQTGAIRPSAIGGDYAATGR